MNKLLSKLWPFMAEAATMVIKESVEPLLDYRPPGITSLKFNKISLGTVPPKIEGIRVQSLKKKVSSLWILIFDGVVIQVSF